MYYRFLRCGMRAGRTVCPPRAPCLYNTMYDHSDTVLISTSINTPFDRFRHSVIHGKIRVYCDITASFLLSRCGMRAGRTVCPPCAPCLYNTYTVTMYDHSDTVLISTSINTPFDRYRHSVIDGKIRVYCDSTVPHWPCLRGGRGLKPQCTVHCIHKSL